MFVSSRFPIQLVPNDPTWTTIAAREIERLRGALGEVLVSAEHVGSTAIPSIKAKPIVDISPVVRSLEELDAEQAEIEALGWEWRGEAGIEGRRYCVMPSPEPGKRIAQAHFYAVGHPQIEQQLAFRDYLRVHDDEARAYEAEKMRARELHPDDVNAYNVAKSDWVRACIQRALAWYRVRSDVRA